MLWEQNWAQNTYVGLETLASSSGAFNFKTMKAYSEDIRMN